MTHGTYFKTAELEKSGDDTYDFVASDETPDRYGDIVRVSGWELKNYRKNPIILFGHKHDQPVGTAQRVWIEGAKLLVRIRLAQEGTSDFIDTLRKLVAQRIIRAVSVGFKPTTEPNYIRDEKNDRITGLEFVGQELLENSLVSVPANPAALEVARSMNVPTAHMERIFRKPESSGAFAWKSRTAAELDLLRLGASGRTAR